MAERSNPCERLFWLVKKAKSTRSKAGQRAATKREALARIFGVNSENNEEILHIHAEIVKLIRDARQGIEGIEGVNHEIYLRRFPAIERAFQGLNFEASWEQTTRYLSDVVLESLEHCSELLGQHRSEALIPADELQKLQSEVERLLEEIIVTDLPYELKSRIADSLETIRRAIITYRLSGGEGLERAFESNLGFYVANKENLEAHKEKFDYKSLFTVINGLNQLITLYKSIRGLTDPILKALGWSPSEGGGD